MRAEPGALHGPLAFVFAIFVLCGQSACVSRADPEIGNQLTDVQQGVDSQEARVPGDSATSDGFSMGDHSAEAPVGDVVISDDGVIAPSGCAPGEVCVDTVCVRAYCKGQCGAVEIACGGDCECFCDEECFDVGDCCPDICVSCGGELEGLCGEEQSRQPCE